MSVVNSYVEFIGLAARGADLQRECWLLRWSWLSGSRHRSWRHERRLVPVAANQAAIRGAQNRPGRRNQTTLGKPSLGRESLRVNDLAL